MRTINWVRMLMLALIMACFMGVPTSNAYATCSTGDAKCTDFACLAKGMKNNTTPGVLTNITNYLKTSVAPATQKLFQAFTSSAAYKKSVYAAVTLMLLIYAASFMIGVTQASFGEVFKRLFKIGLIFSLISPTGWAFFNDVVVKFFNNGTDELIGIVMSISTGSASTTSPFLQLDGIGNFFLSPDMIVAVMASMMASGPYGLGMGMIMGMAVFGMITLLFNALRNYAMSFVLRMLLLGVAPIFIIFLLFEKTKGLFTAWLNALINLSLQPILYFAFL